MNDNTTNKERSSTDVDLTPTSTHLTTKRKKSIRNWIILGSVGVVLAVVLTQALTSARVYYYNVDEAVSQKKDLGDEIFRMQGTVTTAPDLQQDGSLQFNVVFNEVDAAVRHIGDAPSNMFACDTKVVIEGQWKQDVFESNLITVKHSEEYVEENPDRVTYDVEVPPGSSCL